VDRSSELEAWRRSIAMANPGSPMLEREEAMLLIAEVQEVRERLARLKYELRKVLD
jgi:vacuolar-type H+-ATPase subunit D/Vma8